MKFCSHCGAPLENEQARFCSVCGTPLSVAEIPSIQKQPATNSAARITLCILTILGSVLGIIKGILVEAFYSESLLDREKYSMGYASALFNLGTLVGAVLMLNKLRAGYVTYMVFQCANILIVIFWALGDNHFLGSTDFLNPFLILVSSATLIPALLFMALYTFMVKKELR